jgi:UV DNA damage endonuclease
MDFALDALKKAGDLCKKYRQRITMHPGQYNQIGAKDRNVFKNTIKDLKMHADMLDAMGMDKDSVLCIHGGGVYGNIQETKARWIKQFEELPENVKRRIAIENCERCYSIIECLEIAESCQIPLIFDCHHYDCFNSIKKKNIKIEEYMDRIVSTWKKREIRPLFHISQQRPDSRIGAHSDFIDKLPKYYLDFPSKYGDVDIEIEAKMKEQAILRLYKIYPFLLGKESFVIVVKEDKEEYDDEKVERRKSPKKSKIISDDEYEDL